MADYLANPLEPECAGTAATALLPIGPILSMPGEPGTMKDRDVTRALAASHYLAEMHATSRGRFRLAVVWAVVREMARTMNVLGAHESIAELGKPDATGVVPLLMPPRPVGVQQVIEATTVSPRTPISPDDPLWQDDEYLATAPTTTMMLAAGGLPLMPTPATAKRYFEAVQRIARSMGLLDAGSALVPELWLAATFDLPELDTTDAASLEAWTRAWTFDALELELYEEQVLRWVLTRMTSDSRTSHQTVGELRETFGLSWRSCEGLVRAARGETMRLANTDQEEDRAMMVMRIESYISRARAAMDLDSESKGLKMLAAVQGLTRTDPKGRLDEIIEVIAAMSGASPHAAPTAAPAVGRITVDEGEASQDEPPDEPPDFDDLDDE